jgi:intracellular multiplication protein IcmG
MADNDQNNDEYQFADLDAITPDAGDANESVIIDDNPMDSPADNPTAVEEPAQQRGTIFDKDNIRRNALIAVGGLILLIVLYELLGAIFSGKKQSTAVVPPTTQPIVQPKPVLPVAQAPVPMVDPQVNQRLSVLETTQQTLRSDVSTINDQLGSLSKNMDALSAKMTELIGAVATLNAKVDEQAREIEQLTIRRIEARRATHPKVHKAPHYPKYYLQAVIPGRAWLIATNGTTLTVREGTIIAGYGMVKLIDPNQGRVLTSSGKVIRFSQEDS